MEQYITKKEKVKYPYHPWRYRLWSNLWKLFKKSDPPWLWKGEYTRISLDTSTWKEVLGWCEHCGDFCTMRSIYADREEWSYCTQCEHVFVS